MFTGIVEELGTIAQRDGSRLRVNASLALEGSTLGSSIAVNGCCLTVVATDGSSWWDADVSEETYLRTNLGALHAGDVVNLERPMALGDRLGGHMVLGHVDAVGTVVSPAPDLRTPNVVTAQVCGITATRNVSVVRSNAVNEMPSTVTEPFSTIRCIKSREMRTTRFGAGATISPTLST